MNAHLLAISSCLALGACGGVSYHVDTKVPLPRSVAVLPFAGKAAPGLRAGARALWHSRLHARGYLTPGLAWVDHELAQHGWLDDVESFDPGKVSLGDVAAALGVDAIAVGRELDEDSFNFVLLRRQRVGGTFALTNADGRTFWSADHGAGAFGGLLLGSGQLFTELRAQGDHRTSMHTLALVDQLIAETAETVPSQTGGELPAAASGLADAAVAHTRLADGRERIIVTARAASAHVLRFDLEPGPTGIPMVAAPGGSYRGTHDLDAGSLPSAVRVRASDAFGRTTQVTIAP